jgi:hypothetical protein
MTPRAFCRPLNVALLLVICAVILSARLLLGYAHVESAPRSAPVAASAHPDDLPPVW